MNDSLDNEMKDLELNDVRLNKRCLNLLNKLEKCPEQSIPSACQVHSEVKAAYRFFKNPKVEDYKILNPHINSTIARCKNQSIVLFLEDTTEIDYTRNSSIGKLGRLDITQRRGIYNHVSLAVTKEGVPLGIISNEFFSRKAESFSKDRNYRKTPLNQKESYRWVKGIRKASNLSSKLPNSQVIYIADRESDTFHCLFEATRDETKCDIIIRACKDRNTSTKIVGERKKFKKLFSTLEELPIQGEVVFNTQSGYGKKSRKVKQSIQFDRVEVKPAILKENGYSPVSINAIRLSEIEPPLGEKPLVWVLLTTLELTNIEDVKVVIDAYRKRWAIEVYFKLLKNYCKIEDLRLFEENRLRSCISLYMIISWRLFLMKKISSICPDEKCTIIFSDIEWKVLCLNYLKKRKKSPSKIPITPPTIKEVIMMLATLGGYLNRKSDGEPGPKALCIGYMKMQSLIDGWMLCQDLKTCGY